MAVSEAVEVHKDFSEGEFEELRRTGYSDFVKLDE